MTVIHGVAPYWVQIVVLGIWMIGLKCMAADLEDLNKVLGDAVLTALTLAHLTVFEAASLMKINESQLRKSLRGETVPHIHHISLNRLLHLPFSFWLHFSPTLIYLASKRNAMAIAEDLGIRRVS